MPAFDISSLAEKFKDKKFAVPVIGGTAIIAAYVLLRKGGISGGSSGSTALDNANAAVDKANAAAQQAAAAQPSGGSSDDAGLAAVSALQAQQSNFMSGIVDAFNQFGAQVQAALGNQSAQNQSAIDAYAKGAEQQYASLANQTPNMLAGLPDFSSFYQGIADQLASQGQQYGTPNLQLSGNGGNLASQLTKVGSIRINPVPNGSQNYLGGKSRLSSSAINSLNRLSSGGRTIIPNTRGTITRQFNSPNIQSRGGFGGSKGAQTNLNNLSKLAQKRAGK